MCGIYVITLEDNKVMYVGKSKHIQDRVNEHIAGIDKGQTKMYWLLRNMEELGVKFWCMEECDIDRLDELEKFWIKILKPVLNTQVPKGCKRYIDKIEDVTEAYVQALENGLWKIEKDRLIGEYIGKDIRDWLKTV